MKYTDNYNFRLPNTDDEFNIEDFNENSKAFDSALHISVTGIDNKTAEAGAAIDIKVEAANEAKSAAAASASQAAGSANAANDAKSAAAGSASAAAGSAATAKTDADRAATAVSGFDAKVANANTAIATAQKTATDAVSTAQSTAVSEITSQKNSSVQAVKTQQDTSTAAVSAAQKTATDAVSAAQTTATNAVSAQGTASKKVVTDAQATATSAVTTQQQTSVAAVANQQTTSVNAVKTQQTTSVTAVTDAQTTATAALNKIVTDANASIPTKVDTEAATKVAEKLAAGNLIIDTQFGNIYWKGTTNGNGAKVFALSTTSVVDGSYNIEVGTGNKVYANYGLTCGDTNTTSGKNHVVAGSGNIVVGNSNAVAGNGNKLVSSGDTTLAAYNLLVGYQNTITSSNTSTGYANVVGGMSNNVSGGNNVVAGRTNTVPGHTNTVSGNTNTVSASNSIVTGSNNNVAGMNNLIAGSSNTVTSSSSCSIVGGLMGTNTVNQAGIVFGRANQLNGMNSMAVGMYNVLTNSYSACIGNSLLDGAYEQVVVGALNVQQTAGNFVVGVGSSGTRKNGLRVTSTNVYGLTYSASGADYAEHFEWADGGSKEDRVGRIVTLDGEKIQLADANTDIDDVIGIVSANPSVVGDSGDEEWSGRFQKDIFGREIKKEVLVPAQTEEVEYADGTKETVVVIPEHTEMQSILSEDYDENNTYIPRSDRKEWDAIGLVGKLVVITDGSVKVNKYVKPTDGGIATYSSEKTNMRVIKILDDTHALVFIK